MARIEILMLRINPKRHHLQVINRPPIDCHFLKNHHICRVEIPKIAEAFRLGIRAFSLRDTHIGSFVMLNDVRYEATVCKPYGKHFISE